MKIMVISFFCSNNLGDLLISKSFIQNLESKGYFIKKYDLLTVTPIIDLQMNIAENYIENRESSVKKFIKKVCGRYIQYYRFYKSDMIKKRFQIFEEELRDCEMVYFAGGNMIMDVTPVWPLLLSRYVKTILKYDKPFCFSAVGVGPIKYRISKKLLKNVVEQAQYVSVRGMNSGEELKKIGINKFEVVVDPVLALQIDKKNIRELRIKEYNKTGKLSIAIGIIGDICFSTEKDYKCYLKNTIQMIQTFVSSDKIQKINLFSTERMDYEAVFKILAKCSSNKVGIVTIKNLDNLIQFYDEIDYLIGTRMHSLILAQRCMIPFIGICWQEKIRELCGIVGSIESMYSLNEICEISIDTLHLDKQLTSERLNMNIFINKKLEEQVSKIFVCEMGGGI